MSDADIRTLQEWADGGAIEGDAKDMPRPIAFQDGWNIKPDPCHTTIYQVNGPIGEARLIVTGNEPTFTAYGGYHDAGDADRRTYHMDVPVTLMTTYEAFPNLFTDDQFNIPDKFDTTYHILGKGNGIPDILDEAIWGTMFWEYMQEPTGEIHWGTETKGYSPFTTYQGDPTKFGTEVLDARSASFASGMFMHMARAIRPYNAARSEELRKHAELAFAAAGEKIRPTHKLYFAVQKYLLTGDEGAHQMVKDLAGSANLLDDGNTISVSSGSTFIGGSTPGDIGNGAPSTFGIRAGNQANVTITFCNVRNMLGDARYIELFPDTHLSQDSAQIQQIVLIRRARSLNKSSDGLPPRRR